MFSVSHSGWLETFFVRRQRALGQPLPAGRQTRERSVRQVPRARGRSDTLQNRLREMPRLSS